MAGSGLLGLLDQFIQFPRERRMIKQDAVEAVDRNRLAQQLYEAQRKADVAAEQQRMNMQDEEMIKSYKIAHPDKNAEYEVALYKTLHPELFRSTAEMTMAQNRVNQANAVAREGTAGEVGLMDNLKQIAESRAAAAVAPEKSGAEIAEFKNRKLYEEGLSPYASKIGATKGDASVQGNIATGEQARADAGKSRLYQDFGVTADRAKYRADTAKSVAEQGVAERAAAEDPAVEYEDRARKIAQNKLLTTQANVMLPHVQQRENTAFDVDQAQGEADKLKAKYSADVFGAQSPWLDAAAQDAQNQSMINRAEIYRQFPQVRPDIKIPDMFADEGLLKSIGNAKFGSTALPPDASGIVVRPGAAPTKGRVVHKF